MIIQTIAFVSSIGLLAFAGVKAAGKISSLKQASENLLYKIKVDKWTVSKGALGLKVTPTIINPDLNETFKVLYPQLLLLDENGVPFEASMMYDESLKDKIYEIAPRGKVAFDPVIIRINILSIISILSKIVKANLSDYIALSAQIASAIILKDASKINTTQLEALLNAQSFEINKNLKGRLLTRVNGINVSYDFDLV